MLCQSVSADITPLAHGHCGAGKLEIAITEGKLEIAITDIRDDLISALHVVRDKHMP